MAEAEPKPAAPRRSRRALTYSAAVALEAAALAFLVAGGVAFVTYRSREELAERFAEDWLARRINDQQAIRQMAAGYRRLIDAWEAAA